MGVRCLLGSLHDDGRHVSVVPVLDGARPDDMLSVLRRVLHHCFDGDHVAMAERLLTHGWLCLDPDAVDADDVRPQHVVVGGIGVAMSDPPGPTCRDITRDSLTNRAAWLYILDDREASVTVFEATVHGRFAWHSHRSLQRPETEVGVGVFGDAADGRLGHRWRPAHVSLDGLHTAFAAQVCTVEHGRGVIVARFDRDGLADVLEVTDVFYGDVRPGSGIPHLVVVDGVLIVSWYTGTCHGQTQQIGPDVEGRYILPSHVLPWIMAGEPSPGDRPGELRNGVPPIREWVTEAGVHACHPGLAAYSLAQISAALAALGGTTPGVLAGVDGVHVWVIAPTHALMLARIPGAPGTVILPRPLNGSWHDDRPVPVFTADTVADSCARSTGDLPPLPPQHRPQP